MCISQSTSPTFNEVQLIKFSFVAHVFSVVSKKVITTPSTTFPRYFPILSSRLESFAFYIMIYVLCWINFSKGYIRFVSRFIYLIFDMWMSSGSAAFTESLTCINEYSYDNGSFNRKIISCLNLLFSWFVFQNFLGILEPEIYEHIYICKKKAFTIVLYRLVLGDLDLSFVNCAP